VSTESADFHPLPYKYRTVPPSTRAQHLTGAVPAEDVRRRGWR
jgi:hypothetical protein